MLKVSGKVTCDAQPVPDAEIKLYIGADYWAGVNTRDDGSYGNIDKLMAEHIGKVLHSTVKKDGYKDQSKSQEIVHDETVIDFVLEKIFFPPPPPPPPPPIKWRLKTIGAITGAIIGAIIGATATPPIGGAIIGAIIGAITGTIIGAIIAAIIAIRARINRGKTT